MTQSFFDEQTDQSRVKAAIVAKYFPAWARVISEAVKSSRSKKLAYMDLFVAQVDIRAAQSQCQFKYSKEQSKTHF